ncbi:MAG TPA: UvrD-helicase domain-containing protein [Xanthobacteraceae bacterium]|nr:UvrD-helicase domain-containing protein [Xanthobacteraceae bacterium]
MRFHADLHVHSKYSRATSRDLDLEHLAYWAARKGIAVVGTGDFAHPAWRAELKEKLVPAEPGLFRLKSEIEEAIAAKLPAACRTPARFMLTVEISTIYKKGDKTRKVHHLIYAPDFATADRISERLAKIGNIASDGRPILGLDSRDLLEITLESSPDAYFVPAHIWTPWFAALGSQSGFDSIAECYGDLADHIFAVETGLSSDPAMNWRLSMLDRFRLVSNSDAHSPGKLGREATAFDCAVDYFAIRDALKTGQGYVGTVEFFPEEGKYHLDGHRKCGVRLEPRETLAHGGRCPVCGEPMTIGVLHRVEALADRSEKEVSPPATAGEVSSLVPLPEILSEIAASGPASKTVERNYERTITSLGSELSILRDVPVEDIARAESSLLAEAVSRLRAGKVIRNSGYDGEYGVIRLFEEAELKRLTAGAVLFDAPLVKRKKEEATAKKFAPDETPARKPETPPTRTLKQPMKTGATSDVLADLDDNQLIAARTSEGALLIVAGPGSGKTRTLTQRIAYLIAERGVPAAHCLAITFTRRAAGEMREWLARLLPANAGEVAVHTFHSLGLAILREHPQAAGLARSFRVASEAERAAALAEALDVPMPRAESLMRAISKARRTQAAASGEVAAAMAAYRNALAIRDWIDFDDLVGLAVRALQTEPGLAARYRERFRSISVDEFQDIDEEQYRLVSLIAPPGANLCVIGDPNQAIYGFRGADASCFERFRRDHPDAAVVNLKHNYRSSGTIVTASSQVIGADAGAQPIAELVRDMHERITLHAAPSERSEAEFVVQTIERMIGGHSFFSIDSGRAGGGEANLSFADFAVLYRTDAQSAALVEAFERSGIPFKKNSHAPLTRVPAVRALLQEFDRAQESDELLRARVAAAAEALKKHNAGFDAAAVAKALGELTALAETCSDDPLRFADALPLATEADFYDPRTDRVSLSTLHAAKGLEFSVVFIVGLEDGLLPLYWNELDEATAAEERRLFYVGMTRAKDRLLLSRALKRERHGRLQAQNASSFLSDIEHELLKHQAASPTRRKAESRQLKLF